MLGSDLLEAVACLGTDTIEIGSEIRFAYARFLVLTTIVVRLGTSSKDVCL